MSGLWVSVHCDLVLPSSTLTEQSLNARAELADKIRHNFDTCMAKASQYTRKAGSDAANEVQKLLICCYPSST